MVDRLWTLLAEAAHAPYLGESVSQLDHALQCAALAAAAGSAEALIVAALFHDIGHLCADPQDALGVIDHARVGAAALTEAGLGDDCAALVAGHVDAKRYLVARSASYRRKLSPASEATLQLQGGSMSPDEARRFEEHPLADDRLRLRAWDDAAKVPGRRVPALASLRPIVMRLAGGREV